MRQLSATEAIAPAWNHTRDFLITPRRWPTLLKIGVVALFAQVSGCNGNFYTRGSHMPGMPPQMAGAFLAFAVIAGLFGLVLALFFFYLNSRLQFVLFEIVLRRDTVVAPIWRRYGRATWHWMGLKLLFLLAAFICLAPFLIPIVLHFIHLFPHGSKAVHPDFWLLFKQILGFFAAILVVCMFLWAAYRLLYDFGMPSMALEGTPLEETVRRVVRLLRAEPSQVLLYLVMYFLLSMAWGIANMIIMGLVAVVALIPLGGAGFGLWFGLRHAGTAGYIVMGLGWGVLGLIFVTIMFLVILALVACIYSFLQAYALYFLGGRYPLLGEYLEPTPPIVQAFVDSPPVQHEETQLPNLDPEPNV
jgi:hypothetical protein